MGIGIIGKPNGVRLIAGSVYYGEKSRENINLKHRKFPMKINGRSVMTITTKRGK